MGRKEITMSNLAKKCPTGAGKSIMGRIQETELDMITGQATINILVFLNDSNDYWFAREGLHNQTPVSISLIKQLPIKKSKQTKRVKINKRIKS